MYRQDFVNHVKKGNDVKISYVGAALISMTFAGAVAAAECTPESMQARAMAVTTEVQKLAATDPQKMNEVMTKMATAAQEMQQGGDLNDVCKLYDELEAELANAG